MKVLNFKTANCIFCFKKGNFCISGHVKALSCENKEFDILACWHKECRGNIDPKNGFFGEWTPEMGVEIHNHYNADFGDIMQIFGESF